MEIRASMRQRSDGQWEGQAELTPPVRVTGPTRERCQAALSRAVRRAVRERQPGESVLLVVEVQPAIAGVAEAAEIMGWDKRRVITYIDRGSFPPPIQSLASGRIWLRSDLERFAAEWKERRARRASRA
jgi:hypothetical protein